MEGGNSGALLLEAFHHRLLAVASSLQQMAT